VILSQPLPFSSRLRCHPHSRWLCRFICGGRSSDPIPPPPPPSRGGRADLRCCPPVRWPRSLSRGGRNSSCDGLRFLCRSQCADLRRGLDGGGSSVAHGGPYVGSVTVRVWDSARPSRSPPGHPRRREGPRKPNHMAGSGPPFRHDARHGPARKRHQVVQCRARSGSGPVSNIVVRGHTHKSTTQYTQHQQVATNKNRDGIATSISHRAMSLQC
jgi:hypothetical protein